MQTSFNVSNTDVITMLVVKQRELLQNKEAELFLKLTKLKNELDEKFIKLYNKKLEKIDKNIINNFTNLMKSLNPKLVFETKIGQDRFYNNYSNCSKNGIFKFYNEYIEIYAVFKEDDEEKAHFINDDNGISIPFKFIIELPISKELFEIESELNQIRKLLKNETILKEKLIAQVTENAIKNLPEIQALISNTEILKLN